MLFLKAYVVGLSIGLAILAINVLSPVLTEFLMFKLRKKQVMEVHDLARVVDAKL